MDLMKPFRQRRRARQSAQAALPRYDLVDISPLIKETFGEIDPELITAFFPVKNEMAMLPAILAHYRRIGYEQFLFYDDNSDDGTFDYLRSQDDCVVFHAHMTFGERLVYTGQTHKAVREMRFGTFVKMAVPHYFLPGKIVSYFDADEFLILPPGVSSIRDVLERIDVLGSTGAYATMVEFFPKSTESFKKDLPQSFEDLISEYSYFEPEALFDPVAPLDKRGKPVFTAPSKSMRLFEDYGIGAVPERASFGLSSKGKRKSDFNRSARHKTPILRRTEDSFLFSCHDAIRPPSGEILLTLAHFVFTSHFAKKIENARKWKAHAEGASKYTYYAALLDAMDGKENGFLSDNSMQYTDPQQLIDCGLMKW